MKKNDSNIRNFKYKSPNKNKMNNIIYSHSNSNRSLAKYDQGFNTYLYGSFQCYSWLQCNLHQHQQRRRSTAVHRADRRSDRWCCWCYRTTADPLRFQPRPCKRRSPARPAMTPRCCLIHRKSPPSAGSEGRELEERQKNEESGGLHALTEYI